MGGDELAQSLWARAWSIKSASTFTRRRASELETVPLQIAPGTPHTASRPSPAGFPKILRGYKLAIKAVPYFGALG